MTEQLPRWVSTNDPDTFYREGRFLVLDFETDNKQYGSALEESNDLVLACWYVCEADGTIIRKAHVWGGIFEMQNLLDDIASVAFIVCQNLKFELQWLKRCGAELRSFHGHDTLLGAWVIDGNRRRPRSLGALAKRYLLPGKRDLVALLIKLGVSVRDIRRSWVLEYCYQDVAVTLNVFLQQREELSKRDQWHLAHVRNLCCSVLADIEFEGLCLDKERVQIEYDKAMTIKEDLGRELAEMTGGINLNSPKQLKEYLYGTLQMPKARDDKGNELDSANAKVLAKLVPETDEQKRFLSLYKDYNKQVSLLEKNLEYFKLTCEQRGSRFHGEFKQNVVQTHRLASSGIPTLFEGLKKAKSVQLQNIPREFKRLFWSGEEDYVVAEFDGSQLEFRVAVDMAKDEVGTYEIENGVDIHSFTAKVVTDAGEPTSRQEAKAITFRPLYGGSSGTKAVKEYCQFFKDKYKGIAAMQRTWGLKCVDRGEFETPYGMIFYFPDTKMQRSGYITNTTSISNFPVQGFATGEIIPIALVHFWHRIKDKPIRIFSTIHDSIATKVHKDFMEEALEIAKQSMTHDVYDFLQRVYRYNFTVPLGLGAKFAQHWGDTKEETKLDVWPDGRIEDRS